MITGCVVIGCVVIRCVVISAQRESPAHEGRRLSDEHRLPGEASMVPQGGRSDPRDRPHNGTIVRVGLVAGVIYLIGAAMDVADAVARGRTGRVVFGVGQIILASALITMWRRRLR